VGWLSPARSVATKHAGTGVAAPRTGQGKGAKYDVSKSKEKVVQCRFCSNDAISEMDIACKDGVQKAPVCVWHEGFFRWMYSVLGQSVQKRMEIHDIKD